MVARAFVSGLCLLGLIGSWAPVSHAGSAAGMGGDPDERAIRIVLDRQTAAWNRGDLEGYMRGYWKSPDLTFYSGGTITSGWEATLERYRKRYQSEGKEMGRLDFPEETIDLLGPDAAVVYGRWHLVLSGKKETGGLYTVVMKRLPEGWRIVHDHSSSE